MARARAVADELPIPVDLDEIVLGRARLLGLRSNGRISAGGTCRLLPTADGWVAINLPRPWDREALPAVLEEAVDTADPGRRSNSTPRSRRATDVADRYQLLGMGAAVLNDPAVEASKAITLHPVGAPGPRERGAGRRRPLVDVGRAALRPAPRPHGDPRPSRSRASTDRTAPASATRGSTSGFTTDTRASPSTSADPRASTSSDGCSSQADVVIEGSRPRALAQLGIDADAVVASRPGCTWVSITGYGRSGARPTRWPSATTPRSPAAWSLTTRSTCPCSAPTRSPIR